MMIWRWLRKYAGITFLTRPSMPLRSRAGLRRPAQDEARAARGRAASARGYR